MGLIFAFQSKGYITVAKVFLVMTCIAVISQIITAFSGSAAAVDSGVNLASLAVSICVYIMFIQNAEAVRKDVLNGEK